MRLLFTLLTGILFIPVLLLSHDVPNKGFEQWDGTEPVGWTTTNSEGAITITSTEDRHEGSLAIKGTVISAFGFPFPPILITGGEDNPYNLDERYVSFSGWYKFSSLGSLFSVVVGTYIDHTEDSTEIVAAGSFNTIEDVGVWKQFSFNLFYTSNNNPQYGVVSVSIGNYQSSIGAEFYLDDLNWSMTPTSVDKQIATAKSFSLEQNYPNPLNPNTNIVFSLPEAGNVTLKVYDILGNEVQTLVDGELTEGKYRADFNGENLASGTYIYKLTTDKFTEAKTMMLIK